MNQIIIVNGIPRTGKSELLLSMLYYLCCHVDENGNTVFDFDAEKHIAWTKIDLIKKISKYKAVGSGIQWEEAGLVEFGANARDFWSDGNKGLSSLFQTMGFGRQIVGVTLPARMMLDKQIRGLCHIIVDTIKVDKRNDRVIAKIKFIDPQDPTYEKYHRYLDENGLLHKIVTVSVPRAPKHIVNEYLNQERSFKTWLQKRLQNQETSRVNKKSNHDKSITKQKFLVAFENVKKKPRYFWDLANNEPDRLKIMTDSFPGGLNDSATRTVCKLMEKAVRDGQISI